MPYREADLRPGDIVLVEGGGVLGSLIRWSTANPFTHAALATGHGALIEALSRVTASPATKYEAIGWVYRCPVSDADRERVMRAAWERIGQRYGVRELLLDAARFDLHLTPRARPLHHFTCSGLVVACYQASGLTLTCAPWPAPADLAYSPLLEGPRPWSA